ncbi:MAG: helix-turn-helix domain-containing protein [Gammaproteobacteria bacterium]|nr:helix-turn-helix domain-containing protein [Gammaproteobacteria bacterium]
MAEQLYKIGKVSELTGLSVERLRMWEQRHEIRPTKKVNRIRFYDDDQLAKLTLIKELIDQGFSIGELKDLSVNELKPLLGRPTKINQDSELSIVLVGDTWNFENRQSSSRYDVSARFLTLESYWDWATVEAHVSFDALVLLVTSLNVEKIDEMTSASDVPVFVVYKYASESDLELARESSFHVVKMQDTDWQSTVDVIFDHVVQEDDSYTEYRCFDDEQLEHLRRCKTNERVEPEDFVEIVYRQRAIIDHLSRTTDSALDIAVVEAVKTAENSMERALRSIADKHQLLV